MKKIIIVNNNLNCGGIQKSLVNLLNEIKAEFEITLLLFNNDGDYKNNVPKEINIIEASPYLKILAMSLNETRKIGIKYYLLRVLCTLFTKIHNHYIPIKLLVKTQKEINNFDYAISFMHSAGPKSFYGGTNEVVLDRINAKEKIGFIHCDYLQYGGNTSYTKELYSKFDKIVACSKGCKEKFIKVLPELKDKTYYVHNTHNYDEIDILSKVNPIKYNKDYFNIITVSRLTAEKGVDRSINSVIKCIKSGYKIKLHIIGDGILSEELKKIVEDTEMNEHIIFYGNQSNPYRYMKNADLFLLSSYHEAAPMVFNEAQYLKIPILATNTTSTKEMIEDRNSGWVCENSEDGIFTKLKSILDNENDIKEKKMYLANNNLDNIEAINEFKNMLLGEI